MDTPPKPSFRFLIPDETRTAADTLIEDFRAGTAKPGAKLAAKLGDGPIPEGNGDIILRKLLATKVPCLFAESQVAGDGSDWTQRELSILGDISVAVDVTVYDDGRHQKPLPHPKPFPATLIFVSGPLLHNGKGKTPADLAAVTDKRGWFDPAAYQRLFSRRLKPVFDHIQTRATQDKKSAFVTIPGIGCGQFAGPFRGRLGTCLEYVLRHFVLEHAYQYTSLRAVYFDPYNEGTNHREKLHGVDFLVRPLLSGNEGRPQLCHPTAYAEQGDVFGGSRLFSLVAWDPVSWPGNDFFAGARATDDGVKAAATDVMHAITGVPGAYDPVVGGYMPPDPHQTWGDVVKAYDLKLIPEK